MTFKIHPSRFRLTEGAQNMWTVFIEAGIGKSELLEPSAWAHISERLRPFDEIRAIADDGAYYAQYLVINAGRQFAKVRLLNAWDIDQAEMGAIPEEFEVQWKGPHHKHAVVRMKDRKALQTGFASKEDAMIWLASNSKTLAA